MKYDIHIIHVGVRKNDNIFESIIKFINQRFLSNINYRTKLKIRFLRKVVGDWYRAILLFLVMDTNVNCFFLFCILCSIVSYECNAFFDVVVFLFRLQSTEV